MVLLSCSIKSSDALFKSKETLVNFSTVLLGLLACVDYISTSFRPCQINETHFTKKFASVLNGESENGVRSRGLLVGTCLPTCSTLETLMNCVHDLLHFRHVLFRQIYYVYSLFSIFSTHYLGPLVEQVVELSAVDLVET
jgi:hypothetical protein